MSQSAARMNRLQIREQEQLNRERKRQLESEAQRQSQMMNKTKERFSHVKGHGYGSTSASSPMSGSTAQSSVDDVEIRVYVRECDADAAQTFCFNEGRGGGAGCAASRQRLSLPPVAGTQQPQQSRGRIAAQNVDQVPASTPGRGQVPRYLQHRKAEIAAEKQAIVDEATRKAELAKIPPGYRLVSEEEKAATVSQLEIRRRELEEELGRIPLRYDTQAIRTRKTKIEDEMRQIESSSIKYSTKKPLYVPLK